MAIAMNTVGFRLPVRAQANGGAANTPPPPAPSAPPTTGTSPAPPPQAPTVFVPPPPPAPTIGALPPFFNPLPVAPPVAQPVATLPTIALPPNFVFPPRPPVFIPQPSAPKTATQLARGAITQLTNVAPAAVTQGINAIASNNLDGPGIMPYLERKTRIRVVLDNFAQNWDQSTRTDFADAFRMTADQTDAMDAIVSLAILNDKDLEAEIIGENTPQTTTADLTDNRKIVWQYPPAGTVLQPPYVILVAVEYRDVASAEDTFKSISDQLSNYTKGTLTLKVPKVVIQKLG